jgi:hypothetical protein
VAGADRTVYIVDNGSVQTDVRNTRIRANRAQAAKIAFYDKDGNLVSNNSWNAPVTTTTIGDWAAANAYNITADTTWAKLSCALELIVVDECSAIPNGATAALGRVPYFHRLVAEGPELVATEALSPTPKQLAFLSAGSTVINGRFLQQRGQPAPITSDHKSHFAITVATTPKTFQEFLSALGTPITLDDSVVGISFNTVGDILYWNASGDPATGLHPDTGYMADWAPNATYDRQIPANAYNVLMGAVA